MDELRYRAPTRLLAAFRAIGYNVELCVTRATTATVDPDSFPMVGPFGPKDRQEIEGLLGGYEVTDKPDDGPRFTPPE